MRRRQACRHGAAEAGQQIFEATDVVIDLNRKQPRLTEGALDRLILIVAQLAPQANADDGQEREIRRQPPAPTSAIGLCVTASGKPICACRVLHAGAGMLIVGLVFGRFYAERWTIIFLARLNPGLIASGKCGRHCEGATNPIPDRAPILAVQRVPALAHRRGDIAAVDRGDVSGGFQRQCLVQEGLCDIFGGHFAAKQVAGHVVFLAHAARFGA